MIKFNRLLLNRIDTLGFSKAEFAEKMRPWASKSTVYAWLRGAYEPKMVSDLLAIFRVLHVGPKESPEWIRILQLSVMDIDLKGNDPGN